jgi:hypothetical protein
MQRMAVFPVVVLGLAALCAGAELVVPGTVRAAGLDFWNAGAAEADLRGALDEARALETVHEQARQRGEVVARIVADLGDDRLTLTEALEALAELARSAPDWFAKLRTHYQLVEVVSPAATDQEVLIQFLIVRLRTAIAGAQDLGDAARAAVLSARFTRLENEVRLLNGASAHSAARH